MTALALPTQDAEVARATIACRGVIVLEGCLGLQLSVSGGCCMWKG